MPISHDLTIDQTTFNRNADGSLDIVSPGGTDPHLDAADVADLDKFLAESKPKAAKSAKEAAEDKVANLQSLTRAELDALASEKGIEGAADLATKADVIEAIEKAD